MTTRQSPLFGTLGVTMLLLTASMCLPGSTMAQAGNWSKEATSLLYSGMTRTIKVVSPDGRKSAVIDNERIAVVVDGKRLPGTRGSEIDTLAELGWAPDSKAFFITASEGGAIGRWYVRVYVLVGDGIRRLNIGQEVVKDFKRHYKCWEPEAPNVGAVTWVEGSAKLLLVAQVPPHSSCREMGKLGGYVVSVPKGRILESMEEKALRARWGGVLGTGLKR